VGLEFVDSVVAEQLRRLLRHQGACSMSLAAESVMKPSALVKECDTQDGIVLLHPKTGMMFPLDAVGTVVWKGIKDGLSLQQIAQQIATNSNVLQEQVRTDLEEYVAQLRDAQLLDSAGSGESKTHWLRTLLKKLFRRRPSQAVA